MTSAGDEKLLRKSTWILHYIKILGMGSPKREKLKLESVLVIKWQYSETGDHDELN